MLILVEPDEYDDDTWISLTGDDLAETESSTWKLEMYVTAEALKEA